MKRLAGLGFAIAMAIVGTSAGASTVFSSGAGSAVSSVDALADFESTDALYGNPYLEDGISFSRTGLTFNNNGCGYAGCPTHSPFFGGSTPFTGNYMYGIGGGTFTVEATLGNVFSGLEMILGNGGSSAVTFSWETFLGGISVSSGTTSTLNLPSIHGWSDANGFDKLVFGNSQGYPAFDSVRAQYISAVPVPAALPLLLAALGGLGFVARRRKAA